MSEAVIATVEQAAEKPPEPTGRERAKKFLKKGAADPEMPFEPGSTDMLTAMEVVVKQRPGKDKGHLERAARQWLRADPKGFMLKLEELRRGPVEKSGVKWDGKGKCPVCHREADREDHGAVKLADVLERLRSESAEPEESSSPA